MRSQITQFSDSTKGVRRPSPCDTFCCFIAFLFACGGKHSNAPPAPENQSNNDRDSVPDGGADGGVDGGTDGGLDGGTDGGVGGGLSGYTATLNLTRRPQDGGTSGGGLGQEIDAFICCIAETNLNCQLALGEANFSPARQITVLSGGWGFVEAEIYSDANCGTLDRTLSDALYFADPPGFWAVQVDFAPPLPVGLRLSLKWTTNDCETGCVSYTVGSAPPLCWGP